MLFLIFKNTQDKSISPNAFVPYPSPTSQLSGFVFICIMPIIHLGGKGTEGEVQLRIHTQEVTFCQTGDLIQILALHSESLHYESRCTI